MLVVNYFNYVLLFYYSVHPCGVVVSSYRLQLHCTTLQSSSVQLGLILQQLMMKVAYLTVTITVIVTLLQ